MRCHFQFLVSYKRGANPTKRIGGAYRIGSQEVENGGEGGIRTPGTLIRGTHDFQSCTFNRSVTSPLCNFKQLPSPPHSSILGCLQNVSKGISHDVFRLDSENLTRSKTNCQVKRSRSASYRIYSRAPSTAGSSLLI